MRTLSKPNRIATLVLGCASPPYDIMIDVIQNTWGKVKVPGVDMYYLYGNPNNDDARSVLARVTGGDVPHVADNDIRLIQNVLIVGCADNYEQQEDSLLRKRLIAFEYLASTGDYDLIYTVCATSYVNQGQLIDHANRLRPTRSISGAVGLGSAGTPFVSGASMLLSVDVAKELGRNKFTIFEHNQFGLRDDLTIGHWIGTHMSPVPYETLVHDIRARNPLTPDHIFAAYPHTTVDYVLAPAQTHQLVNDAFHYHFHSQRPNDMIDFHLMMK